MYVYIRKLFANDANGNQISFTKDVAQHFLSAPESFLARSGNASIRVFHMDHNSSEEDIEIQPATDFRFSTRLNSFLHNNGQNIEENDLLYMEKRGSKFGVRLIKSTEPFYAIMNVLLSEKDRHFLVCADADTASDNDSVVNNNIIDSRQIIFYGAPGTGKSNTIEDKTNKQNRIRTTFHPDSDYSTFVGAYKPTMEETGVSHGDKKEKKISYTFVPQAFLKAYINAWKLVDKNQGDKPYYLVIEEINRGNCAQIFGDLFQLLDRDSNGASKYSICPDDDIKRYLDDEFSKCTNLPNSIKSGEEMRLPENLYIWATMNTSDQSLFPIDSAFKRRWDWEYVPIENGFKDFVIEVGNKTYDWWSFICIVNEKIDSITGSEDKKLGYWFAKPAGNKNVITCKQFVSKVLFYLWNDVYKDYSDSNQSIFRIKTADKEEKIAFTSFFGFGAETRIQAFMEYNGIPVIENVNDEDEDEPVQDSDGEVDSTSTGKDHSRYSINGQGEFKKTPLVREVVKLYCQNNPSQNANQVKDVMMALNTQIIHFIETQSDFDARTSGSTDTNLRAKEIKLANGESIYVSTQIRVEQMSDFIEKINNKPWGITIARR